MIASVPYEQLVQAGRSLVDADGLAEVADPTGPAARAYLAANREQLAKARAALGPTCRVPLVYDDSFIRAHAEALSPLRNLAMSFHLGLCVAAADGDQALAVRYGVDQFDLANATRRGGLIIDFLVAVAVTSIGLNGLRLIRRELAEPHRARLIHQLRRAELEMEPLAEVRARDEAWEAAVGYRDEEQAPIDFSQMPLPSADERGLSEDEQRAMREALQAFAAMPKSSLQELHVAQENRTIACLRLLSLDLTLRAWRDAHGAFPADLGPVAALTAETTLIDPFTQQRFRYRRQDDDFLLYSLGPSQTDHGGVFGSWVMVQAGHADLSLDGEDADGGACEP